MTNLIDNILAWIERTSSKVHGWAWDKRWKSRDPNEWIKGYKKWKDSKKKVISGSAYEINADGTEVENELGLPPADEPTPIWEDE